MPAPSPRVCVVGSANVDLTFRTPRLPRPGETVAGRELHVGFGGKGANQAVAAARLGAAVSFVGLVGDDPYGADYLERLGREGLDTTYVRRAVGQPTGTAAILVDDDAQNCIVVAPGANGQLTPQDVRDAADAIRAADALLCQLEVPLESTREALRIARDGGVRTVFNPAPASKLDHKFLNLADLLITNLTEMHTIAGEGSDIAEVMIRLYGNRSGALVVTMGEQGAMVMSHEEKRQIPAFCVTAVDTTGAGDAFTAALAVGWAQGQPLCEAARRAAAAAALTVTRLGTQTAFPTLAEVESFLAARSNS